MRRRCASLLFAGISLLLLLLLPRLAALDTASAANFFLKTAGNEIRDAQGKAVALRGTNLGGWLLFEGWMTPMDASGLKDDYSVRETLSKRFGDAAANRLLATYQDTWLTGKDLDHIAALGLNCVRLPFWYRNVQDEDGAWREDAFQRLDWLVEQAGRRGLYVILDLHGAPGGQSDGDTTGRVRKPAETGVAPDFWNNETNLRRTAEIWRRVAGHFRGNPAVAAYDVLNEPTGAPDRETLWAVYDRLYQAIRAADPDHLIAMEGCWGGRVDGQYLGWGWDALPPPEKFGWTNVLYQMHAYEWVWDNLEKQKSSIDRQVNDWRAHRKWNVPCLIGEFNPMAREAAWKYALEQFNAHGMSWTTWTYKATHGTGADSWGLYNPRAPLPPKPDIQHDSADEIRAQWSKWGTEEAFALNPMTGPMVGAAAGAGVR